MLAISVVTTVNQVMDWLQLHLQERASWDCLTIRLDCIPPDQLCRLGGFGL